MTTKSVPQKIQPKEENKCNHKNTGKNKSHQISKQESNATKPIKWQELLHTF
jgi:hypothetical protein